MVVEVIEPTPHFEQKNSERIGAHQIEMRAIPMFVSFLPQLAEGEPFQIKRQNPVLSEIDAALLLVFDRFSLRPHVTVDVQYRGRLPSKFFWLVKNRYGLKAGNDFIAQFMKAVTLMGLDAAEVFELRLRVDPFIRPAVKHDILQQTLSQPLGLLAPLHGARRGGGRRNAAQDVRFDLKQGSAGREDLLVQNNLKVAGSALRGDLATRK